MSKRTRILLITLCFCLALFSVATYSFMFRTSEPAKNEFEPGQVGAVLSENSVTNSGNTAAYIRVRYVTYCTSGGSIVGANSPAIESFSGTVGWMAGGSNAPGCYTWYYKVPIAAKAAVNIPTFTKPTVNGYDVVVEVFAEAIQANPADAAIEAWGVGITDKEITSAP